MNREQHISALMKLTRQYNPDNDLATPVVSSTEMALIIIIKDLIEQIDELECAVDDLKNETGSALWSHDDDY